MRDTARSDVRRGFYDVRIVEIEVEEAPQLPLGMLGGGEPGGWAAWAAATWARCSAACCPRSACSKKVTVAEARRIFAQQEADKLVDSDAVKREALRRAAEHGIVFIDEIDKVAGSGGQRGGPDVSREGVQRDILPIVEGSTVQTKHGPLSTDHVLFIAAGAFHVAKPSDLIPELQGRFPVRVELDVAHRGRLRDHPDPARERADRPVQGAARRRRRRRSRSPPTRSREIARIATQVNEQTENIGARRLHTVLERVLDEIAFRAPEEGGKVDDRRRLRARAAGLRRRQRRPVELHSLAGLRDAAIRNAAPSALLRPCSTTAAVRLAVRA